jgi:hypothetical protein
MGNLFDILRKPKVLPVTIGLRKHPLKYAVHWPRPGSPAATRRTMYGQPRGGFVRAKWIEMGLGVPYLS